jgi:photosystem II stability/assembly factor-like uncharacterized protein
MTKDEVNAYVYVNTAINPYASKSSNQLVVKSNLECGTPVVNTQNLFWRGIANNETTSSPIQLIAGLNLGGNMGTIHKSTDYGQNYSSVFNSGSELRSIKFMPAFRHASYLSVPPFLAVGISGRIITNSNNDATSWIAITSPSTQSLYDIAFNTEVGIIVGNQRILKTNTNNRINSWSIVNSVASLWRAAGSSGSRFVAVGDNSSIISGNSTGTTWTVGSMPPLVPSKQLLGVTFHTDGYWYAVGRDSSNFNLPYIMKSTESFGLSWELYFPTGDSFIGGLYSIASIGGRLVIGGSSYQYQIINDTVTRCSANTGGVSILWQSIVKDAASNGFDMAGGTGIIGGYSNF